MNLSTCTPADLEVLEAAKAIARRLHIDNLQEVGAALRTASGEIFSGIHFESATGFATICGEVAAMSVMVAAGHRDLDTIAAVVYRETGDLHLLPPCGRCREMIADFNPRAWVILSAAENHWQLDAWQSPVKARICDLLPRKSHWLPGVGS